MSHVLAQRLRELRKNLRLTQQELADQLHVAQTTIANYEKGTRLPDLEKLAQLSVLFRVSVDYLLGKELQLLPSDEPKLSRQDYFASLKTGDKLTSRRIILGLLRDGMDSQSIYRKFLTPTLEKTGDLWEAGKLAVWQEHLISETITNHLALMKGARRQEALVPKRILCLLPGAEAHMIGLRMMGDLLEEKGHQVHFLGNYLPTNNVLQAIDSLLPDFVLLSVTMDSNLDSAKVLIDSIRQHASQEKPTIIIGGKAVDRFNDNLGADAVCQVFEKLLQLVEK